MLMTIYINYHNFTKLFLYNKTKMDGVPQIRILQHQTQCKNLETPKQPVIAPRFHTQTKKNPSQSQVKMSNQHRLKLKDYLRLTTISKRSNSNSVKKRSRQNSPEPKITSTPVVAHKSESLLDTQKSLVILKDELKSDLIICLDKMEQLTKSVEKDNMKLEKSEQQYQQLVFLCELHRLVKQNIMGTLDKAKNMIYQHRQAQLFKFSALAKQLIASDIKKSSNSSRKRNLQTTSRFRLNATSRLLENSHS